jgi:hypothetical protein
MTKWGTQAKCLGQTKLFFSERENQVARAKSICAGCPLSKDCLELALEGREAWGVWGGYDYPMLKDEAARRGIVGPNRSEIEHGTERGWAWHRRQKLKDPEHVTCEECVLAYNLATKIRVKRYRERLSRKDLTNGHPSGTMV